MMSVRDQTHSLYYFWKIHNGMQGLRIVDRISRGQDSSRVAAKIFALSTISHTYGTVHALLVRFSQNGSFIARAGQSVRCW